MSEPRSVRAGRPVERRGSEPAPRLPSNVAMLAPLCAKGTSGATRDPQPNPWLTALFKTVAVLVIAISVTVHGIIALLLGGPPALGVFLLAVVAFWVWAWFAMRRSREASPDA